MSLKIPPDLSKGMEEIVRIKEEWKVHLPFKTTGFYGFELFLPRVKDRYVLFARVHSHFFHIVSRKVDVNLCLVTV